MITFLTSNLGKALSGLVVALGILIGVFQSGRKVQKKDQRVQELEEHIETVERIDNVEVSDSRDDAIERLRNSRWVR